MINFVLVNRKYLDMQITRLRNAETVVEKALSQKHKKLEEWYEEQQYVVDEDEDPEARRELDDFFADKAAENRDILPRVLRTSLFGAAYSVLEHFLVNLCRHYERYSDGVKLKDLRGDGIDRARTYLKKVVGIPFPDTSPAWQALIKYRRLRNAIVHSSGVIDQPAQDVLDFQPAAAFELDQQGQITLGPAFNESFLGTVEDFADALSAVAPLPDHHA